MILSVVIIGYFLTKNLEISLMDMFNKIKESPVLEYFSLMTSLIKNIFGNNFIWYV